MDQKEIPKGGFYWERTMYQSDAFLSLSKNAMKFLIALMDARIRSKGYNKARKRGNRAVEYENLDRIQMPYKLLKTRYSMNGDGIARAKDELLSKGFISITHTGGTGQHDCALYALIEDYRHWAPGIVFRKRSRDAKRGYQGKRIGATGFKCCECGTNLTGNDVDKGICATCILIASNRTRAGNLTLVHAVKPDTKSDFRVRKPDSKENANNGD